MEPPSKWNQRGILEQNCIFILSQNLTNTRWLLTKKVTRRRSKKKKFEEV